MAVNAKSFTIPEELTRRILFTIFGLVIYRLGVAIPTPGVDANAVLSFFQSQSGGIFGMFNTFTGGALSRFSIFALGIMPYISASIIFQLLQSSVPALDALSKEGDAGRKKINQYTRYATLVLSIVQAYAISTWLLNSNNQGQALVKHAMFGPLPFQVVAVVTLSAGTCFLMWLGDQMTEKGIGNGISMIIFASIAAGIPQGALSLWQMLGSGDLNIVTALALLAGMVLIIAFIIFIETGQRRISIQYSQRGQGKQQQASYLPLKLNFAGVIPPIFASSLLLFPATITQFSDAPWLKTLQQTLSPSGSLYNILFIGFVVFFCFFYTEMAFKPNEVADNLKKNGGFVPGIRAGKSTASYIQKVLDRLTISGAIYLSFICVLPTLLINKIGLPFYFGGTSLLILVGVAIDTLQQIQSHLISAKYEGMGSAIKVKSRRVRY